MKVSINLATYNRKILLRNTLDSILRQTQDLKTKAGHEVEIVVIDDGSTDDTYEWVKHNYSFVVIETTGNQDYNATANVPYNRAAEISTGQVIIQQNAETFHWSLDTIDKLVAAVGKKKAVFPTCFNLPSNPFEVTQEVLDNLNNERTQATLMYCGIARKVAWFFCGVILKEDWDRLGGYGDIRPVDVNFAKLMEDDGFKFEWLEDTFTIHQSHNKG